jgi:hypothetical protein
MYNIPVKQKYPWPECDSNPRIVMQKMTDGFLSTLLTVAQTDAAAIINSTTTNSMQHST